MKPLLTRIRERVLPTGPLRYLPPDALFGHAPIGSDSNNRLAPLTRSIGQRRSRLEGASVLDLGSNAGHFPLLYSMIGARLVVAVEPRKCFERWFHTSLKIFWPDECRRIAWHRADIRKFTPSPTFDVISCLGLIYHVPDVWTHLNRIVSAARPKIIFLESQLFPRSTSEAVELSIVSTMTCNGFFQRVPRPTVKSVHDAFRQYGWTAELVLSDWPNDGQSRGFWIVETHL